MLRPESVAHTLMIMRVCAFGAGFLVSTQLLILLSSYNRRPG